MISRMINRMTIGVIVTLIAVLSGSVLAQRSDTRIGDDYARAALRVIIYTNESGITMERISFLLNEADVEASTPAEESSLKELNRILGAWIKSPSYDHQNCYRALKANLKARTGAIPEACR
jgi:hypothetical protein